MLLALVSLACLMGAAGVGLAAAAAHAALPPGSGLESASYLLMIHATAVLAASALTGQSLMWRPAAIVAMAGFVLGAGLFAGDISMRAFAGHPLFSMAAPSGGTLLILSWLVLALAAIVAAISTR